MGVIVFQGSSTGYIDVDEGTQAIVLAEVAARVFVARRSITDVRDGFQTDERAPPPIVPKAGRPLSWANCAGFAAVLMHDNLRLFAVSAEAGLNEVALSFDHSEIVLCAALEDKARTEGGQIRNTGNVEEDVFREHVSEARENLLRSPVWRWKFTMSDCMNTAHP